MGGNRRMREALEEGDILYVDSGNAMQGGGLFKVDPMTGERTAISMGGLLQMPFGVTVDARSGMIVVSDSGRLVAVDPMTGEQAVIADNANGLLGMPCGMDFDTRGNLAVANAQGVIRMDAREESIQVVAMGGSMRCPVGVAASRNGDLYVANMSFPSEIIRVDSRTGEQTVVSRGGLLNRPQAIAVSGRDLYVTDVASPDGNFGTGRVLHIDAMTGKQSVVSEGDLLVGPVGITVEADGQLVVGDPYTINPESPEMFDGAVMRIDPTNGEQTLLTRGAAGFVNPRGVVVVPPLSRTEVGLNKR
jgi:sugar lactone lactonase YvrE